MALLLPSSRSPPLCSHRCGQLFPAESSTDLLVTNCSWRVHATPKCTRPLVSYFERLHNSHIRSTSLQFSAFFVWLIYFCYRSRFTATRRLSKTNCWASELRLDLQIGVTIGWTISMLALFGGANLCSSDAFKNCKIYSFAVNVLRLCTGLVQGDPKASVYSGGTRCMRKRELWLYLYL